MACELTTGFTSDCKEGIGGIKEVLLVQWDEMNNGYTLDGTTQEVDTLPTATLYRYQLRGNGNSYTETGTVSDDNGTIFYQQVVTINLFQLSATKRKELLNVAKNQRLAVFVWDRNDNIFWIGRLDGANVTAMTAQTGAAHGDLNGYTITFTANEALPAVRLESFTTVPFDNFNTITVSPAYVVNS